MEQGEAVRRREAEKRKNEGEEEDRKSGKGSRCLRAV